MNFAIDIKRERKIEVSKCFLPGFLWSENPAAAVQNVTACSSVAAAAKAVTLQICELKQPQRYFYQGVVTTGLYEMLSQVWDIATAEAKHPKMPQIVNM